MGRVQDGDIHRFEGLAATGIVGGDFNVVRIGGARITVHIEVRRLIGRGRDLQRFNIANACRTCQPRT